MPTPIELADETFLVEVLDPIAGATTKTLSDTRSPLLLLSVASTQFEDAASRYFKAHFELGTIDWRVVFLLAREPGATASQISKTLGFDKGAVSRCLQRLDEAKLLASGELQTNGRSRGWHLTEQGRRIHEEILQVGLLRQRQLLAGLTQTDVHNLCTYLGQFLKNLEALNT
jgi:DNA-binding MarR family transcriptional regulator